MFNVELHWQYNNGAKRELPGEALQVLAVRQNALEAKLATLSPDAELTAEEVRWLGRSFPVLAVFSPVMSTSEGTVEFPGDPMSLYSALSLAVDQAISARGLGLGAASPYNDLCPRWGAYPSREYRRKAGGSGIRNYDVRLPNTDQTVFDPHVWNDKVREYFLNSVLPKVQPRVVLISATSPAHRYALDIARAVKEYSPECLVILGGRHTDETIHYDAQEQRVDFKSTSVFRKIYEGKVEPVIDFAVAGQGYYALDLLMKAVALAMDIETKSVKAADVMRVLSDFAPALGQPLGYALIVGLNRDILHTWVLSGPKVQLHELPAPYKGFVIRARFPIFQTNGETSRTAHFMVTNSCPYHCFFCSESSAVVGAFITFGGGGIQAALERMLEYIEYGAEAIFFDDSIFWGGNVAVIVNFCREWIRIRNLAEECPTPLLNICGREIPRADILNLQWGAQFTVDILASRNKLEESAYVLKIMREAGCNYVYMGIESMAEDVIVNVHKNLNRKEKWDDRVRRALGLVRQAGLRAGSSVLFGLEGESDETIAETVLKVEELLAEDLLMMASPNILTYHPNTAITQLHQMEDKLDYHSVNLDMRPPYSYFEEAFPAVVSKYLSEEKIWNIHAQTQERWGSKRNQNRMEDAPPEAE